MSCTDDDHDYNVRVHDDEIRTLLVRLEKPYRSLRVLRYFHEERQFSTREIASLFNTSRQNLQQIVYEFDWSFSRQYGRTYWEGENSTTLADFEEDEDDEDEDDIDGLDDLV